MNSVSPDAGDVKQRRYSFAKARLAFFTDSLALIFTGYPVYGPDGSARLSCYRTWHGGCRLFEKRQRFLKIFGKAAPKTYSVY
ncbi:hypothetical protein [Komagataeibacter swingsii]|uniref:hypothetical protein n=1 Tax=Komagataeibacter swingsii TaxID=215220 RepID=UPI0011B5CA8A|nr:hypothetical protein [Komagataeibacter swingsii]